MVKEKNMSARMGLALLGTLVLSHLQIFADGSAASLPESAPTTSIYYTSCCPIEIDLTLGLDNFRSFSEGSFEGNWGAFTALNLKAPLPSSFSIQLAGSYGLYDWYGRSLPKHSGALQQQGFITLATSRQTEESSGVNAGLAYDCMLNRNFGLFAVNPFFYQIRGQLGYLIEGGNELGVWASYGINRVHEEAKEVPLRFRALSQVNLFWCHYFKNNGYTMIWAGTPYRRGLMYSSGRPGTFTLGAQFSVPMTTYFSIQGTAAYMGARRVSGIRPSSNYAADIAIGITYSFGKRRIMQGPYMTPANNSNFMADTNQNF
jgi:hypothetical protein